MTEKEKFFIAMAIPYASSHPHIGNSYEGVLTDSIARFKKLQDKDVFFLTGLDSHGQKIERTAAELGVNTLEFTKGIKKYTEEVWDALDVRYDKLLNTTDEYHKEAVRKIFSYLFDKGDIYKDVYTGWYCVPDEAYFTDSQVVDGMCPECGRPVEKANEESYFFKLTKYQKKLEEHLEKYPDFVVPDFRKNEMVKNFLEPGLNDLAVTRTSFSWGVDVPFDKNHVIYVWIDALANYITALGYAPDNMDADLFKKLWPADLQVIGKEILRFHMIYWPILLMALDLPLPKQILVHPWIVVMDNNNEPIKMSKSLGNVVYAKDFVKFFGTDATRYYLLSSVSFNHDSPISYKDMILKYNAELANTLGNLVNRTISMQQKYFNGVIGKKVDVGNEFDKKLYELRNNTIKSYLEAMDSYQTATGTKAIMELARGCNKYIDETMPWVLAKNEQDIERLGTVLYNLLENIRVIAILLNPIIPETSIEILNQINANKNARSLSSVYDTNATITGSSVNEATPIFARIDEAEKMEEVNAYIKDQAEIQKTDDSVAKKNDNNNKQVEEDKIITFDEFLKVRLVVAEIKEVENIEKADKLYKVMVDDGSDSLRQIVSGLAEQYTKEELLGRKVIVVANLKPAKLRGVESCGMLLAGDTDDGKIKVIFPDETLPNGSVIH